MSVKGDAKKLQEREQENRIYTKIKVKRAVRLLVIAWTLRKKKERIEPSYLNLE